MGLTVSAQKIQQQTYDRYKRKQEINLPNYDERLLHYGFFLALNYNRTQITRSNYYYATDTFQTIQANGTGGFALGFLLNVKLADQLSFKVVPSVGFYDYSVLFTKYNGTTIDQTVETTFIETQFLLKYRSIRRKNSRMYLIGGIKPAIRAGGKKSEPGDPKISMNRINLSIDYGAGFELYFPYFKWSPEIRFSHGLLNLNADAGNDFNKSLSSILTHTVTLYFFFE